VPRWQRALVTGASSGIGRAIARRLAADGTHLVVVARREDRLVALAAEFPHVEVEIFVCDLTVPDERDAVIARLQSPTRPIDLLVNNAGIASNGHFHEIALSQHERVTNLNIVAVTALSHAPLARMMAAGRGTLINISSISGRQPDTVAPTYAATKAFVTSLTQAINAGLRGSGVTATAVLPGITPTEIDDHADHVVSAGRPPIRPPRFLITSAEFVAREALEAASRGRQICVPGRVNRLLLAVAAPYPTSLKGRILRRGIGVARRLLE
jgi:short-subunit dehydrogenase